LRVVDRADRFGRLVEGGVVGLDLDPRQQRGHRALAAERVADLLFEQVADQAIGLGAEHVQRVRRHVGVGLGLQGQQADLRAVAVNDDQLVFHRHCGQTPCGDAHVVQLVLRSGDLLAAQQRVAADGDDDAHLAVHPSVATSTALIVCMRFSACVKTIEASDSKTSSVTSIASRPKRSCTWRPISVCRS
jgi:hypothetical protein